MVLSRHAPADGLAAVSGIEGPEIVGDEVFRNGAQRYVCRVGPVQVIDRAGQGKTVGAVTAAIAQDRVFLARIVGDYKWAIIVTQFDGLEQMLVAERQRRCSQQSFVAT